MAAPNRAVLSPDPDNQNPSRPSTSDDEDPSRDLDTMKEVGVEVPLHPIPAMQGAFAESMLEVSENSTPKSQVGDAETRRRNLIDQPITQETHAARWRPKAGQQYHQLWKLMAQISFGIYLLLNGIAKDDEQVMSILQAHVDEVDEFLETTLEDFDLAVGDIEERLKLLKLPLERVEVFDAMLQDRAFRLQIVTGNEKIDHVITRTTTAMSDALKDVKQGVGACKAFHKYLVDEEDEVWRDDRPEMQKVFDAMKGNVDGWYKAYVSLQTKGNHLGGALTQLSAVVTEIDRRAGEISRKTRVSAATQASSTSSGHPSSRQSSRPSSRRPSQPLRKSTPKPLSLDPSIISGAISVSLPDFQLMGDRETTTEPTVPGPSIAESSVLETYLNLDDSEEDEEVEEEEEEEEEEEDEEEDEEETDQEEEVEAAQDAEKEPEPEKEEEASQYILAPRTYTPLPSPRLPSAPFPEPTPPPEEKSSPEEVDQIRDDDGYWGPRQPVFSVAENAERQRAISASIRSAQGMSPSSVYSPQELEAISSPPSRELAAIITPPPEDIDDIITPTSRRRRDSDYGSDPEKSFSPPLGIHPALLSSSNSNSHSNHSSVRLHPADRIGTPPLSQDRAPSSRSDHQYFLPVHASPNSPLQRPWTAAPSNHHHNNSDFSTLSTGSNGSTMRFPPAPSSLRPPTLRNAPSAMGMSTMSRATGLSDSGTAKTKKKRNPFGWFKKAFALSDEERMAFEERRLKADDEARYYNEPPQQRWLDGKRIR